MYIALGLSYCLRFRSEALSIDYCVRYVTASWQRVYRFEMMSMSSLTQCVCHGPKHLQYGPHPRVFRHCSNQKYER